MIFDYLVNGFVDCTEETFFQDVYRLPAGHCMVLDKQGRKNVKPYYSLPYSEKLTGQVNDEIAGEFRRLFQESIKLRLRADVPVGSCLSGGLDSSSIMCESSRQLKEQSEDNGQKTFSAYCRNDVNDERQFIDAVVEKTGVDAHYIYPTGDTLFTIWSI